MGAFIGKILALDGQKFKSLKKNILQYSPQMPVKSNFKCNTLQGIYMSIIIPVESDMVVVGSQGQPCWPAVPFCGLILSWVSVTHERYLFFGFTRYYTIF